MKRFSLILLLIFSFFLPTSPLLSYSSPNVPVDDPVYRDIDRLIGLGLVKDVIYGQRPWSREEIARIIRTAQIKLEEKPLSPEIDALLKKLQKKFQEEIEDKRYIFHPLSYIETQYTFLDSEARPIPPNGVGTVDALIEPLTAYDEGRHFPDGHQLAVETEHYLTATRFFSFYVRPRFQFDVTHDGDADLQPFVQQVYAKFAVPHFELEVGRDSLDWGQGKFGGFLVSNNARPFDMVKVSNPSPTIIPWIFKYLGPFRYSLFVANLGPEREFFPYSFLTGLKLSFKPVSFFEFGLSQLVMMGGDGAPPLSIERVLMEFIGYRGNTKNVLNFANRETGFDFRFYFPFLRNTQLYWGIQLEDTYEDLTFVFTELSNHQVGLFIPRIDNSGATTLRLEYHHVSPYFYGHGTFTTGMALNRRLWGDALGPQADGVYAALTYDLSAELRLQGLARYERRDGDVLTELLDPGGKNRRVIVVTPRPAEQRIGVQMEGRYFFKPEIEFALEVGYERILSFNFVDGDDRNGFLGRASAKFYLF